MNIIGFFLLFVDRDFLILDLHSNYLSIQKNHIQIVVEY
jgi:hypothetical protein